MPVTTASTVTISGTSITLTLVGYSFATLFVEWLAPVWPPAVKPEVTSAIQTLCVALVIGVSMGGAWLAELLRQRIVKPKLESNQPPEPQA